jgi:hypothetical protein
LQNNKGIYKKKNLLTLTSVTEDKSINYKNNKGHFKKTLQWYSKCVNVFVTLAATQQHLHCLKHPALSMKVTLNCNYPMYFATL